MADISTLRSGLRAYADDLLSNQGLVSNQYNRSVLLSVLAGKPGSDKMLRPPGDALFRSAGSLLGGPRAGIPRAKRMAMAGSNQYMFGIQTGTAGGAATVTARGTTPTLSTPTTNSQDQKKKMAAVKWTKFMNQCYLWNVTKEQSAGESRIGNAITDAVGICTQDMFDLIIEHLWVGVPSDQTAERWDALAGIDSLCTTNNVYLGIDRSSSTYWAGLRNTNSVTSNVALIDDANLNTTDGIMIKADGIDLVLANLASYNLIKADALTKNGTLIHRGTPQAAQLGITQEAVLYGNTLITFDPGLKDWSAVDTDYPNMSDNIFMTSTEDLYFQTMDGQNFVMGEFVDLAKFTPGANDARAAYLTAQARTWCEKPWTSKLYTAASTS